MMLETSTTRICAPKPLRPVTADDFATRIAQLHERGATMRLVADSAGLCTQHIVLNDQCSARIFAGEKHLIEALAINRQHLGIDLSYAGDPSLFATAVERFVEQFGELQAHRRCWFQIDCRQAQHESVQKCLEFANVNVVVDSEVRHSSNTLQWLERFPNWSCVFSTHVGSACTPLGYESAAVFLPGLRLAVPKDAAVLTVELDVCSFVRSRQLCFEELASFVREVTSVADYVLDRLIWPLASLTADAFMNRRIALVPRGLGDALLGCGFDPADPIALTWLRQLLQTIRKAAHLESAAQARAHGRFPAMRAAHVFSHLSGRPDLRFWQQRWELTVCEFHFRHRHLLYLTLDSLWPENDRADPIFGQLLPALAEAEGIGFGPDWPQLATNNHARPKLLDLARATAEGRIGSGLRLI